MDPDYGKQMMTLEEIDTHRKHWEADKHWELRKNFMLTFYETLPRDELLCKAQLYVNIKLLKNEYNQELMNEIKAMAIQVNNSSRKILTAKRVLKSNE